MNPITPWSLLAAILVAAQFAVAQDFAPASLSSGSTIAYSSTVNDSNEGVYLDVYSIAINSPTTFEGGTYTYTKTGPTTATLNYTANYTDPTETETGSTLITFTNYGVGTFTSSGSYSGNDEGFPFSGTFTSFGTFTYNVPGISNVADLATNEDTSTGAIPFTIGDSQTASNALTVTRASSNTALVPLANVVLGGTGTNRTVTITPAANQSGTSTITLTVSDGTFTATDTFVLTVVSVNDTPTISDVTDKSTNEDTATSAIPFTVGDIETSPASLTITRASSNTALVPLANVVLGGSGASRTVTITPAPDQSGTSTITLTVSDGSLTVSDTFLMTVVAVNDAPTISNVTDKSTNEDTVTVDIPFTIGDVETSPASLTVTRASSNTTLVPLANVVLGGSGSNRTATITPAANQSGTTTITLTVSDGTLTATDIFVLTVVAVNDTPTISDVTDKSTNEDTATSAISFTIGDVETSPASLTVTRASSNTALIPLANVVLGGSGASRTVTITPAADQSGTSTITLTVNDGSLTVSDTFLLTVVAINDAPTISNVTDKSTNEDTVTAAIAFTVADTDTDIATLSPSAASSNLTLVPQANIVFGGSGANRTVTITPAANQSGTSTITLTVSDGSLTVSDTFVLTVTAINDTPTISDVSNTPTNKGITTGAIAFTIGDIETATTSLTVTRSSSNTTLVPLASVVLGGSGANRTVTITPAANQIGTSTITLNVSDGVLTATDTFVLTVIDGQTVAGWRQTHFSSPDNTGNGADTNDFDKDGIVNLMEYALGSIPTDPASANKPVTGIEMFAGQPYLSMTITKPPGITGVTYLVEVSESLVGWESGSPNTTIITNDSNTLKVRDNTPANGGNRFLRLKVTNP